MLLMQVTEKIEGAHPQHPNYPLLPGDLLAKTGDGTWTKEAPGLAVVGFVLTTEQIRTLQPRNVLRQGLDYYAEVA